jgi:hypothetical protein
LVEILPYMDTEAHEAVVEVYFEMLDAMVDNLCFIDFTSVDSFRSSLA